MVQIEIADHWTYLQWLCFQEQFTKRPKLSHKGERYQECLQPFLLLWQNLKWQKILACKSDLFLPFDMEFINCKKKSYLQMDFFALSNFAICTRRSHFCLAIIAMDWAINLKYKRAHDKRDSRFFVLDTKFIYYGQVRLLSLFFEGSFWWNHSFKNAITVFPHIVFALE